MLSPVSRSPQAPAALGHQRECSYRISLSIAVLICTTGRPRVKAADHASDESAPSLTVIQVPTVIPISVTSTNSAGKETVTVSFSSAVVASTVPSVAHVEAATT